MKIRKCFLELQLKMSGMFLRHSVKNVAIANALQLEAARAMPDLPRFNYDAMPSLKSLNLSNCRIIAFSLLIHYFTLWPWPLTFDLEHFQRIACEVMKLGTKFERNRAIRGGVIVMVFDLMTLNIVLRVVLGSGIIFTKFDLRQLIRVWIIAFFAADMSRCGLDFDPLTLKASHDQSLYKISAKSSNPRLNYW